MACPKNNLMSIFSWLTVSRVQIVMSHFFSSQNLELIVFPSNLVPKRDKYLVHLV